MLLSVNDRSEHEVDYLNTKASEGTIFNCIIYSGRIGRQLAQACP
jgi:hypothetical protein